MMQRLFNKNKFIQMKSELIFIQVGNCLIILTLIKLLAEPVNYQYKLKLRLSNDLEQMQELSWLVFVSAKLSTAVYSLTLFRANTVYFLCGSFNNNNITIQFK